MKKGKISNYKNGIGQILSEGNTYNFNINVVRANDVADGVNVEFELDHYGNIKIVNCLGATKPTKASKSKKENTAKADNRELLTEDK